MRTIEFYSEVPGLADAFPVIPAKEYTAKWMAAARQDYINTKNDGVSRPNHVYQCPGIFDLFNHGFIVPMWHDVFIKTEGNKDLFAFMLPSETIAGILPGKDVIGRHVDGLDKFMPKRPWSLNPVIKFNTPWHVVAPKGVKFLVLPICYPDTFEFESCTGILDPGYSNEINFQVFWNKTNGEHMLKAGTPMVHIIPLTEEKFELVCRDMNKHDYQWLQKFNFLKGFSFSLKRNLVKDLYNKHFGNKNGN